MLSQSDLFEMKMEPERDVTSELGQCVLLQVTFLGHRVGHLKQVNLVIKMLDMEILMPAEIIFPLANCKP